MIGMNKMCESRVENKRLARAAEIEMPTARRYSLFAFTYSLFGRKIFLLKQRIGKERITNSCPLFSTLDSHKRFTILRFYSSSFFNRSCDLPKRVGHRRRFPGYLYKAIRFNLCSVPKTEIFCPAKVYQNSNSRGI